MKLFLYCFREFDEKDYFEELSERYDLTYAYSPEYPNIDNAYLAQGYEAISLTPMTISDELLETFHKMGIRYITTRSIGYEHLPIEKMKALGMHASHVAYPPETVADYAIMSMMMSLRKMPQIMERSTIQDYTLKGKIGRDIGDCKIGVIGTGRIGSTVIRHLQGFGPQILAYDPYVNKDLDNLCSYVSLEQVYKECDVITLHIPAGKENYHLINQEAIDMMKQGVIIINTARGSLIDTDVLIHGIESGKVGGAALDVLEKEDGLYYIDRVGDPIDNHQMAILRSFPNVILTPHTAFYSEKVVRGMALHTVQCIFDMQEGKENPLILI